MRALQTMKKTLDALFACAFLAGAGILLGMGYNVKSGISLSEARKPSAVHVERAEHTEAPRNALNGRFLATSGGALDLSFKPALFFSPDAGCREALEAAR